MNKFEVVKYILESDQTIKSVLDVGCRDCILKKYIGNMVFEYKGVDLYQNQDNIVDYVCDFEKGLKINDDSYDCVVALDLVEHLNDFDSSMKELLRLSRKYLVVNLPNIAHLLFRINFLMSGNLGEKYRLKYNMEQDRHRWVTILSQTDKYMEDFSKANNLKLKKNYLADGKKMKILKKIGKLLHLSPNIYIWSVVYVFEK